MSPSTPFAAASRRGLVRAEVAGLRAYSVPRFAGPLDLFLDANEGPLWDDHAVADPAPSGDRSRRYPSTKPLEAMLAERLGVDASRLIVTAGGDDAIDRCCRAVLGPDDEAIVPAPTFEMIARSVRLAGARVIDPPWPLGSSWPIEPVLAAMTTRTRMIAVVTPNNPTGATVPLSKIERLAREAPASLVLADLAYAEFDDDDLTPWLLELPNVVVVRTLSKAWSMAGLRVGYAAGPVDVIGALRAVGGPYPVAGPALALAEARLGSGTPRMIACVDRVRAEREKLAKLLRLAGCEVFDSRANFVLARSALAAWLWHALASLGISVRRFDDAANPALAGCLRITCPGNAADFDRLEHAIRTALMPEAILLDMDGVLADASSSYEQCILRTASSFGVPATTDDLSQALAAGDANNDWVVTHRLVTRAGIVVTLADVTERFERLYLGESGIAGLRETESLIPSIELLRQLAAKIPLGIVTGRPRRDAEWFLRRFGLEGLFRAMVCMGEASAPKPDAAPVRQALKMLGVRRAWMVGDTPDDIRAARSAGAVPIAVRAPGRTSACFEESLQSAGAASLLESLREVEGLLL